MPLLIIFTKHLEAIRRELHKLQPPFYPPGLHLFKRPMPLLSHDRHECSVSWRTTPLFMHQIKEIFQQLFHLPSIELFPIGSTVGVTGWKENFSLWRVSLQLRLRCSVPLYSNFWGEFSILLSLILLLSLSLDSLYPWFAVILHRNLHLQVTSNLYFVKYNGQSLVLRSIYNLWSFFPFIDFCFK